jgi:hypothetical protein
VLQGFSDFLGLRKPKIVDNPAPAIVSHQEEEFLSCLPWRLVYLSFCAHNGDSTFRAAYIDVEKFFPSYLIYFVAGLLEPGMK